MCKCISRKLELETPIRLFQPISIKISSHTNTHIAYIYIYMCVGGVGVKSFENDECETYIVSRRFIFILTYAKTQNVQVFRHKLIMTFSALNYYFCLCCSEKFPCQTDFAFTCPHINSTYFSSSKTKMHTNLTYKEMESSQPTY